MFSNLEKCEGFIYIKMFIMNSILIFKTLQEAEHGDASL